MNSYQLNVLLEAGNGAYLHLLGAMPETEAVAGLSTYSNSIKMARPNRFTLYTSGSQSGTGELQLYWPFAARQMSNKIAQN